MSTKTNSQISNYLSKFFQPAILFLLLIVVWQIFSSNRSEDIIKEQLDKTEQKLNSVTVTLEETKNNIDSLQNQISFFGEKSKILTLERDSLLLKFKKETAANWESLQNIIKHQKEVNAELAYLRNKNKDFE